MKEVVLEAGGLLRGSSGPALETFLRRYAGVHYAEASYLSDTVTVGYDEVEISEAQIRHLIEECGYHCRGEIVPLHLCAPELEATPEHRPPTVAREHSENGEAPAAAAPPAPEAHVGPAVAARPSTEHAEHAMRWERKAPSLRERWPRWPTRWATAPA